MRGARRITVAALLLVAALPALLGPMPVQAAGGAGRGVWAVQLAWDDHGAPWSPATFAALRRQGIDHAELNLAWSEIEPAPGRFDFAKLDADQAAAATAGVGLLPIFWQSVWAGNPAGWITDFERTSTGATGRLPAWWDVSEQRAYFDYVTATIAHLSRRPGFGGALLDYGWLDAMWGPPPPGDNGISGYAAVDVVRFRQWLPATYGTIQQFDTRFGTAFTSYDQVPAATPGQPLFPVYQAFRLWSVSDTYGRLTARVRAESRAPLYYYWGGSFANALAFGNLPDIFFPLARRYGVTVILDDADQTGLAVAFGSMARAYGVPLLQEWTPGSGLEAEAARWLGHFGLAAPVARGEDFFIYQGGQEFDVGFPRYARWIPTMRGLRGSYPRQPVALYVSFAPAFGSPPDGLLSVNAAIANVWRTVPMGFAVVTDREVRSGVVDLSRFRAVLPVNGSDEIVQAYAARGGHVLTDASQLASYGTPYVDLSPNGALVEATPTVSEDREGASIVLAEVNPNWAYDGSATVRFAGLGLRAGPYHLVDGLTGRAVPAASVPGGLCAPLSMAPGDLALWQVRRGPAPPGTPVPPPCPPQRPPGSQTVTATAGQPPAGLTFLNVGATGGGDGNLRLVTQGGVPAVATWTTAQSGTGTSYAYLQLDPTSVPATAAAIRFDVTYWAAPGQGFQVQYDGAGGAYESAPAVTGPGTGGWVTAQVSVGDARFAEAQNGSADFRILALDGTQPLILRQVSLTAG